MDAAGRLREAIKQTQIAHQEVEETEVSREVEQALESLQNALEPLEKED